MAATILTKLVRGFAVLLYLFAALAFMAYILDDYIKELLETDSDVLYSHLMRMGMIVCTINLCKIFVYNLVGFKLHACALDEPEERQTPRRQVRSQLGRDPPLSPENSPRCPHCGHRLGRPSDGKTSEAGSTQELPQSEAGSTQELPQSEAGSTQELPQSEVGSTQELTQSEAGPSQESPRCQMQLMQESPLSPGVSSSDADADMNEDSAARDMETEPHGSSFQSSLETSQDQKLDSKQGTSKSGSKKKKAKTPKFQYKQKTLP